MKMYFVTMATDACSFYFAISSFVKPLYDSKYPESNNILEISHCYVNHATVIMSTLCFALVTLRLPVMNQTSKKF